jgi:hypothetical protein
VPRPAGTLRPWSADDLPALVDAFTDRVTRAVNSEADARGADARPRPVPGGRRDSVLYGLLPTDLR